MDILYLKTKLLQINLSNNGLSNFQRPHEKSKTIWMHL